MRTYVPVSTAQTAHPSGGTLFNRVGHYYASVVSGNAMTPREFQSVDVSTRLEIHQSSPYAIASDLSRNPSLSRIIVWDRIAEYPSQNIPDDPISKTLASGWRLTHENLYPVYYHWNWSRLYVLRRREYVKSAAAPAPSP
jgi:hypothetical protein